MLNIAAYKFADLSTDVLPQLRVELKTAALAENLRGTVLLSPEGINLFLAGETDCIERWQTLLKNAHPAFSDIFYKKSYSDGQPFNRMLVKIKKEIIAFGLPEYSPLHEPAPNIKPSDLKQWLDEGRPVTLLDARNDYEVRLGTFEHAVDLNLRNFRDFPKQLQEMPLPKNQPVVTFCTGGIRCEKAAPLLKQQGYDVYQLEGGILQYFEDCGNAHYVGECFVFDQRVALDPQLAPTDTEKCFVCWHPLTPTEQQSPQYVLGESCEYCAKR